MVEMRLLVIFIVTCALGLAIVLDLFQLHVHSVIVAARRWRHMQINGYR